MRPEATFDNGDLAREIAAHAAERRPDPAIKINGQAVLDGDVTLDDFVANISSVRFI